MDKSRTFREPTSSFSYDRVEKATGILPASCIVHFRPHKEWDGTDYGFDWMRTGDTEVFGDMQAYDKIVGKQYHNAATIGKQKGITTKDSVTDTNVYQGTFKPDYDEYRKLAGEYNTLLMPAVHAPPPLVIPNYYCPWLSLFPKNTVKFKDTTPTGYRNTQATLRLYVHVVEEPDYLEFEENKYFSVTPMKISDDLKKGEPRFWNGGATVTIECMQDFRDDQEINIFACKKDERTGRNVKKLAGRLIVWANFSNKIKQAKILLVNVKIPPLKKRAPLPVGKYSPDEKTAIEDCLRQALITAQVEEYRQPDGFLNLSEDSQFLKLYSAGGKLDVFNRGNRSGVAMNIYGYLYDRLQDELLREGKSRDLYKGYCILFHLGAQDITPCYAAANVITNSVVVFQLTDQPINSVVHEVFHCLHLEHSFANYDPIDSRNALHTYKAKATENIMDYSHLDGKKCYSTRHWQWVIANQWVQNK